MNPDQPLPEAASDVSDSRSVSRRTLIKRGLVGAAALGLPSGLSTTYWLSVEHSELRLPKWTADGYKVAFISDLHVDTQADADLTQRAIRAAIRFEPEVIIFGGDYLTGNPLPKLSLLAYALQPLALAKCSVLGILGNHDVASENRHHTYKLLKESRVHLLINEEATIKGVRILGFDDAWGNPQFGKFSPRASDEPTIVAVHEPDLVQNCPRWAHLQLSGHSHGGQICLPGGIPMFTPPLAKRYFRGFISDAPVPLYVTRGIGTRRVGIRYFCRPEVTLLTLRTA